MFQVNECARTSSDLRIYFSWSRLFERVLVQFWKVWVFFRTHSNDMGREVRGERTVVCEHERTHSCVTCQRPPFGFRRFRILAFVTHLEIDAAFSLERF